MTNNSNRDRDAERVEQDLNEDPLSGAHGSHPVGTGVGTAAGGAAAGAAVGALGGGPIGAAVGVVAGGIAGGLAGKAIGEQIDPTVEHAYWKDEYRNRPYYEENADYETTYGPAYQHGWESRVRHSNRSFDEAEPEIRRDWETSSHGKNLKWEKAKLASRDAWHRVEKAIPGDADRDGR